MVHRNEALDTGVALRISAKSARKIAASGLKLLIGLDTSMLAQGVLSARG
jgi:hypothetical protein